MANKQDITNDATDLYDAITLRTEQARSIVELLGREPGAVETNNVEEVAGAVVNRLLREVNDIAAQMLAQVRESTHD